MYQVMSWYMPTEQIPFICPSRPPFLVYHMTWIFTKSYTITSFPAFLLYLLFSYFYIWFLLFWVILYSLLAMYNKFPWKRAHLFVDRNIVYNLKTIYIREISLLLIFYNSQLPVLLESLQWLKGTSRSSLAFPIHNVLWTPIFMLGAA